MNSGASESPTSLTLLCTLPKQAKRSINNENGK
jgi:hypothetical protein